MLVTMTVDNAHTPNVLVVYALSNVSDTHSSVVLQCPGEGNAGAGASNSSNGSSAGSSSSLGISYVNGTTVNGSTIASNSTIVLTSSNVIHARACAPGIVGSTMARSALFLVRMLPPAIRYTHTNGTLGGGGIQVVVDTAPSVAMGYPLPVVVRYTLSNETDDPPYCIGNRTHPQAHALGEHNADVDAHGGVADGSSSSSSSSSGKEHGGFGRVLTVGSGDVHNGYGGAHNRSQWAQLLTVPVKNSRKLPS